MRFHMFFELLKENKNYIVKAQCADRHIFNAHSFLQHVIQYKIMQSNAYKQYIFHT
jgi:hypothetical protein